MSHFNDTWGHAGRVAKVILVLIILYALLSVFFLVWVLRIAPVPENANDMINIDTMWIGYTIVSFVVVILISAFHLSVMMFRRNKEHTHHENTTHTGSAGS